MNWSKVVKLLVSIILSISLVISIYLLFQKNNERIQLLEETVNSITLEQVNLEITLISLQESLKDLSTKLDILIKK